MATTLLEAFRVIDHLTGDTAAERALLDMRAALTELANSDRLPGASITVRFGTQREAREMDVNTRLDMPLKRKGKFL